MTTKLLEALTLAEEVLTAARNAVDFGSVYDACGNALAAIREQKAELGKQAEQEPVIDLSKVRHESKCCYWDDETFCDCYADSHALLEWHRNNKAAPVQQVGLTDEEELELARSSVGKSRHWLVAAAIAAYKAKQK